MTPKMLASSASASARAVFRSCPNAIKRYFFSLSFHFLSCFLAFSFIFLPRIISIRVTKLSNSGLIVLECVCFLIQGPFSLVVLCNPKCFRSLGAIHNMFYTLSFRSFVYILRIGLVIRAEVKCFYVSQHSSKLPACYC